MNWRTLCLIFVLCLGNFSFAKLNRADTEKELRYYQVQAQKNGWSFELGLTPISGMSPDEVGILKKNPNWRSEKVWRPDAADKANLPAQWDWRFMGVVTEVRDQAYPVYCGSCWAFGSVAAFESAILIKTGVHPIHIAEQQLVSCRPSYGTCGGGDFAFGFFKSVGANYDSEFPYQARDVDCNDSAPHHEKAADWGYVGGSNDDPTTDDIKAAILKYGPVAATVSASGAWDYYKGGVYDGCNQNGTNHIIAIVGWDDETQTWIIKNSHSTQFGEDGYIRMKYTDSKGRKCNRIGESAAWVVYNQP